MRLTTIVSVTMTLIAALAFQAPVAHAGNTAQTSANMAAFRNFTLDNAFFDKYLAVQEDIAKDPCGLGMVDWMKDMAGEHPSPLDKVAAHWDAKPGVHAMLSRHDITAEQMMLGTGTLMMAALQDLETKHPGMASGSDDSFTVSKANMDFYHAHSQQLRQHQMKLGRQQMKANGGKLPACFAGR